MNMLIVLVFFWCITASGVRALAFPLGRPAEFEKIVATVPKRPAS